MGRIVWRSTRIAILVGLLSSPLLLTATLLAQQANDYGPEVKSFLELMRHEDDELEYQIAHNEISRPQYQSDKSCIAFHRQAVLNIVTENGKDVRTELHI